MQKVGSRRAGSSLRLFLREHPSVTERLFTTLERIGREDLAWKVETAVRPFEMVELQPPPSIARPFLMDPARCADQIVRDVLVKGWESFERPLPDIFALSVRALGGAVLDVGANTGFYSLLAAAASHRTVVHAFEPYPPVQARLRRNVEGNDWQRRITIVPTAVSDQSGEAKLFVPEQIHLVDGKEHVVETSCSLDDTFKSDIAEAITVPVTTLDLHARRVERVGVVKVDVEGMEDKVLTGAQEMLARHRPIVFFEVLPHVESTASVIEEIRTANGYLAARLTAESAFIGGEVAPVPDTWNHVLLPPERRLQFEGLVEDAGLSVRDASVG